MANVEGEGPNLDDLEELLGASDEPVPEEAAPTEPTDTEPAAEPILEPVEAQGEPTDTEAVAEIAGEESKTQQQEGKEPDKTPIFLEWGGLIGVPLILLALALLQVVAFSTAIYVISVGFVAYGIWKGRETNTVFTVILGCALVAILTAIYCLWLEMGRYQFDVKAREARPRVSYQQSATSYQLSMVSGVGQAMPDKLSVRHSLTYGKLKADR